jgi:hypothetical protein
MFGWELRCLPFKPCKVQLASCSTPIQRQNVFVVGPVMLRL